MRIEVDVREKDLLSVLGTLNIMNGNHEIISKSLPIGDVIIYDDANNERIIIERKSLYDLAASIKDGRYKEQSFRLSNSNIHNHNIIYLIEGDWNSYSEIKGRMDKNTLMSACITLNHYKGFSVWKTQSLNETSWLIVQMCNKMKKMDSSENSYFSNNIQCMNNTSVDNNTSVIDTTVIDTSVINTTVINTQYCEVSSLPREKKKNITNDNAAQIMLSCLPGVSVKSAQVLINYYGSLKKLLEAVENKDNTLQSLCIESTNGKTRKIGKNVLDSLEKLI